MDEDRKLNDPGQESGSSPHKFEINWNEIWEKEVEQENTQKERIAQEKQMAQQERIAQEARQRIHEEKAKKEQERMVLEEAKRQYRAQTASEQERAPQSDWGRQENRPAGQPAAAPPEQGGYGSAQAPRKNGQARSSNAQASRSSAQAPRANRAPARPSQPQGAPSAQAQAGAAASSKAAGTPKKKKRSGWYKFVAALTTLAMLYCVAVFSNIPFIAKWRTIYIETAMSTLNHHWLATAFIPGFVIDNALSQNNVDGSQDGLFSNWTKGDLPVGDVTRPWNKAEKSFFKVFPEIDKDSFYAYLDQVGDAAFDSEGYLMIDEAGLNDAGTSIVTTAGDQVLAINTRDAITIIRVNGEGYTGKMAIVKDPAQVSLGLSAGFDSAGQHLGDMARDNGAILAINASGFNDPNGHGDGSNAFGMVLSKGELHKGIMGNSYKVIAFDKNDELNIGEYTDASQFRDGIEFKPALIINGETLVSGSAGWGIAPRSVLGQRKDGQVLLLIVDGRAPGYSIGCTLGDCATIMERYNAIQASNLDGGSSSLMIYNGTEITRPSAANKEIGRHIPNGFMVSGR